MTSERPGELVLVRHGETEWSKSGQHTGRTDIPLTDNGVEQAKRAGRYLGDRSFALALSSPLQRARDTAHLIGVEPELDEDLYEWDYGAYEGLTTPQIKVLRHGPWDLWTDGVPAGDTPGENAAEVRVRVERILNRARPVLAEGHDAVFIAHGHVLRALGAAWIRLAPQDGAVLKLGTASVSILGYEHGRPVIDAWNIQPRD
ncbi:histidine phosphatase family protein [Curtobacterium flaccumfaciens]|jgi:probable phosphoglycerate mutase|uniref:Histidine phosphatase family protein n=1 Tax=Curtobacterium poinsettiae TaxID=159612 RepID=A0A9Q9T2Y2_9MICO|nr:MULTISPECIES: histidine phosphatase family protein [Curtobacterium]MBB1196910.1 histidine phosphatase family protein [Curtobacterium flaccumfaciens]MBF4594155.1 histidine phosphatase family protein [Curtobacterium flaccumfaciens]MBF4629447.1 histidine phosphatase family protein [Curtobacterium flaccumfaciens]MBO9041220.1 histidine phosphatase family protein [Curtobacterium flaccumfaciens pv. flaccumfaciens]MBO9045152.1 histidine phosphatase family protein [Curtobacterium flaccumfaciens pv. 